MRFKFTGLTLATAAFLPMAEEAAERFSRFTGAPSIIESCEEGEAFAAKCELGDKVDGPVVFFDADLWFERPFSFDRFVDSHAFCGTHNPMVNVPGVWPNTLAERYGVNKNKFITTALTVFHPHHKQVWEMAAKVFEGDGLEGRQEEAAVNAALAGTRSPVMILPPGLNYSPASYISRPNTRPAGIRYALHAAGYGGSYKEKFLKRETKPV